MGLRNNNSKMSGSKTTFKRQKALSKGDRLGWVSVNDAPNISLKSALNSRTVLKGSDSNIAMLVP